MSKILIVQSQSNSNTPKIAFNTVLEVLQLDYKHYEHFAVYDILSIPCAISIALEAYEYHAIIALGYIIENVEKNIEQKLFYTECIKGISDIALHYVIPVGIGVFIAKTEEEAERLAASYAKEAALSCMQLLQIKNQTRFSGYESASQYHN